MTDPPPVFRNRMTGTLSYGLAIGLYNASYGKTRGDSYGIINTPIEARRFIPPY